MRYNIWGDKMKIDISLGEKRSRSCGDCTKCCDGWLTAMIYGEEMYPGKPCRFVKAGTGCTIYESRPDNPCKGFSCNWILDEEIPEKFKPSEVGVIIHWLQVKHIEYLHLTEAGGKISKELADWFTEYCTNKGYNFGWTTNGKEHYFGGKMFTQLMKSKINISTI